MNTSVLNSLSQFCIPFFTLGGQLLLALKFPEWALVSNLLAQPFWLYASWRSFRHAGQIGILITTVVFTGITIVGIINYWK